MIGVLTHHWAKKDSVDSARKLLDGNWTCSEQSAGFRQSTDVVSAQGRHADHVFSCLGEQRDLRFVACQPGAGRGDGPAPVNCGPGHRNRSGFVSPIRLRQLASGARLE